MSDAAIVVLFLPYGLAFFVLGVVALGIRRSRFTPIPLFRELVWLAAFGIIHGIAEWLTIFIRLDAFIAPIRAYWFLLVLNVTSFWSLLRFGVGLLSSYDTKPRHMVRGVTIFGLLWLLAVLVPAGVGILHGESGIWSLETMRITDALGRYTLGLVGSLTTAVALYRTARSFTVFNVTRIVRALFLMSCCFALYGLSTGIIVPAALLFPATILNTESFLAFSGFPVEVLRAVAAATAGIAFFVFGDDVRRAREDRLIRVRESLLVTEERERFGQDLHDRVIQTLFAAGLQLESAERRCCLVDESDDLGAIRILINESIEEIRRFIAGPAVLLESITLQDFFLLVADHCERLRSVFGVHITFYVDSPSHRSTAQSADSVREVPQPQEWISVLYETVSNAVRHGSAREIRVRITIVGNWIALSVRDDGTGFSQEICRHGTGLDSMHARARRLSGELVIVCSHAGGGASVTMNAPLSSGELIKHG